MNRRPVLIVEDDEVIRENLREILEMEGFSVQTAGDGKLGLEAIKKLKGRCVVLLDLQMPVMSGEELIEELKADGDPALQATPVIVISARGTPWPVSGIPFLRKPIELEALLSLVKQWV